MCKTIYRLYIKDLSLFSTFISIHLFIYFLLYAVEVIPILLILSILCCAKINKMAAIGVISLKPSEIRFTHDNIGSKFRDGRLLVSVFEDLLYG